MTQENTSNRGPIRVVQFGLGPIGIEAVRLAASRDAFEVVGGVDIDPAKIGKSVGELIGAKELEGAPVAGSFEEICERVEPDVVIHAAGSKAGQTLEQCRPMIERGVSVVSSCEELLYPWLSAPDAADSIDEACQAHDARVLGTGVNPGFLMDLLPVVLTGVCTQVKHVYAERVVNASTRREPLQRKVGSTMDPDEFRRLFAEGKAGHAGFKESLALVAHGLGWQVGEMEHTCEPVVAEEPIKTDYFKVEPGQTRGLHQVVRAATQDGRSVHLDLQMYLDAEDPHDAVKIDGEPPLHARFDGGVAGDKATVAAMVNAIPRLLNAAPGLRLMTELAAPACAEFVAQRAYAGARS